MTDPVGEFLRLHLTAAGAVVEAAGSGLDALLPAGVATELGVAEEVRFSLDGPPDGGAVDARLGSPLLERALAARRCRPPLGAVALAGALPRSLPDHLPVLLNAVRRGPTPPPERVAARYLAVHLRLTLQGDELRHTGLDVALRLEDGARVPWLDLAGAYPVTAAPLTAEERAIASRTVRDAVRRAAPTALAGALEAIGRRARRDLMRMAEYYTSLDAEMARAIGRTRSPDEQARRRAKRTLLRDDLAARRSQLRDRLAARLGAEVIAATLVETEADRWTLPVRRRARDATVLVGRRAGDGTLEGPPCAGCGESTLRLHLCDDRLHALCEGCGHAGRLDAARCPGCRPPRAAPLVVSVEDTTAAVRLGGEAAAPAVP